MDDSDLAPFEDNVLPRVTVSEPCPEGSRHGPRVCPALARSLLLRRGAEMPTWEGAARVGEVQGEVQDVLRGGARTPRYRDSGGGVFCMRRLPDHGQRTRSHGDRYITGGCLMQFAVCFKARWRLEIQLEAVVAVPGDMP